MPVLYSPSGWFHFPFPVVLSREHSGTAVSLVGPRLSVSTQRRVTTAQVPVSTVATSSSLASCLRRFVGVSADGPLDPR